MMRLNKESFVKWLIIIFIIIALYPVGCYIYWSILAFGSSPEIVGEMRDSFRKLPSQVLIKRLNGIDFFSPYAGFAMDVLAERKEKEAVPALIKLLRSQNKPKRNMAIWALSQINDERAIRPLMDIVKQGEKHPDYDEAILALSVMKYEGAYSYVEKIAEAEYPKCAKAITYLKEFRKPESIKLLMEMKGKIKDDAPLATFNKSLIDDAIAELQGHVR